MTSYDDVVKKLDLSPHPEGGHFRRTYCSSVDAEKGRATASSIYYLFPKGTKSRWHTIDADELWYWHAGDPLKLSVADKDAQNPQIITMGPDIMKDHKPQHLVPAWHWQSCQCCTEGEYGWTLVSNMVTPEFKFSGFSMADKGWQPEE